MSVHVRTYEVDPGLNLASTLGGREGFLWSRRGDGLAAWGEHRRIEVPLGEGRLNRAKIELQQAFAALDLEPQPVGEPIAFGSFTFDEESQGSVLVIPEVVVTRRAGKAAVTLVGDAEEPELRPAADIARHDFKIRYAGSTVDEVSWLEAVALAVKEMKAGAFEKVVLARDVKVWAKEEIDLSVLLARLADSFPDCYTFACSGFVGASPELLVSRFGRKVASLVLAGTAPRAEDGSEDAQLGSDLAGSQKDLSEHAPAVVSVVETLGPMTDSISVSDAPFLLKLRNLQHLATSVEGTLTRDVHVLELVEALHPTAAVCGAPTELAKRAIKRLEGMDRARYAGPVGWTNAAGDGEWAIALRCAEFKGSRGRLFAGGGIVAGSEPEAELEETRVKLRAVQAALEGV
jgi:menaquinone-specific isochorismate synthase